jgi:hypothetical protein
MSTVAHGCLAALFVLVGAGIAAGQPSKSAPLARELAAAMDAAKIDSLAARDPADDSTYVGALYLPGLQLLVISARYPAPQLLDERLARRAYRDVYVDLNSAGVAETKVFVEDLSADGLQPDPSNQPFDSVDMHGRRITFDGSGRSQKLSASEYREAFEAADRRYAEMLEALLAEMKRKP